MKCPIVFRLLLSSVVIGLSSASPVLAPAQTPRTQDLSPQDLAKQLGSPNPADVSSAMATILQRLTDDPLPNAPLVQTTWLPPLLLKSRTVEALQLCDAALLASPSDTAGVAILERQKISLLRSLHRSDEALSEAKAYFNVCPMADTDQALILVAECLNAARGNESPAVEKLVAEQKTGLASTDAAPATSPTLLHIPLNSARYQAAIHKLHLPSGEPPLAPQDLLALGNLLLLSDHSAAALQIFTRMQQTVGPDQLRTANEGIARSMRAIDGTVGPANTFALQMAR